MQILPTTNTNFKAKLDITTVKKNKSRWANIAKIFSEETKTLPSGKINVFHDDRQCCLLAFANAWENNIYPTITADIYEETAKKMFESKSDDIIAITLANFLKLGVLADEKIKKIRKASARMAENYNSGEKTRIARSIFNERFEAMKGSIRNEAKQDDIMKDWEISA